MRAILINDHAKWCALTMNGIKKIIIRKGTALYKATQKLIDEYGFAEFYVRCSMAKHIKDYLQIENGKYVCNVPKDYESELNGKVVFKFRCYKAAPVVMQKGAETGYGNNGYVGYGHCEKGNFKFLFDMEKETCLEHNEELCKYLNNGKNFDDIYINKLKANDGCAIHISDLEIFDKPKELYELHKPLGSYDCNHNCGGGCNMCWCEGWETRFHFECEIQKAPQSWCYIEVE